jgi:predicted nucleic acid-binding protein
MNVYVETNFVLELAFMQEQHSSCEKIVELCHAGSARLVLPAFCIAESYEALIRRAKRRSQIANELVSELQQLSRSEPYKDETETLQRIGGLLARTSQDEDQRLHHTLDRLLQIADVIPLEATIVAEAAQSRVAYELDPQDALVFASVSRHLAAASDTDNCFINRNRRDFDNPRIQVVLLQMGCRLLFNFDDGYGYIGRHSRPTAAP